MGAFDHAKLEVGDTVAYMDHHGKGWSSYARARFATVAKLTATQYVLSNGSRFRRDTGRLVGGSPYSRLIDPKGADAVSSQVLEEHNRVMRELQGLRQTREPNSLKAMAEFLDRVAAIVAESRDRVCQIGAES